MIAIYLMINDESYTAATNDGPISLKEAKQSPDWPEWEKAIQSELEQLQDMGTWEIVKKPLDAIPITNKWLFVRKTNNIGQIDKYKAQLVIKGCSQRPGFDYNETYSPVVRLETVRTILSMVPDKNIRIQQMDVKGAYLNGILKEDIYMRQPEGYGDGSDNVCRLIKTLYRLKQSGREWNIQFDKEIQSLGFTQLLSDPCTYIRRNKQNFQIITVCIRKTSSLLNLLFCLKNALLKHLGNSKMLKNT
jgi:Reverse transcriptase (RNA-dependent DNA polymerase)